MVSKIPNVAAQNVRESRTSVILSIAGTDPSGGAGIQADLKTFTSLECYGASVVTALVAQNTTGVQGIHAPPPAFVEQQLRSVLDDLKLDAIKTGMLYSQEIVEVVVKCLQEYYGSYLPPLVVDPVCVSTSGHTLLNPQAVSVVREKLFPLSSIVTPNIPEAELLLSRKGSISSVQDMLTAAKELAKTGPQAVLLKGGHTTTSVHELQLLQIPGVSIEWSEGCTLAPDGILILQDARATTSPESINGSNIVNTNDLVVDVLYQSSIPDVFTLFVRPRIDTQSTHGTGCTLAATLACQLGTGKTTLEAVHHALEYTSLGILTAPSLGHGHGPLNYFHAIMKRSLALPNSSNPFPFVSAMIRSSYTTWKEYVQHPFVKLLGSGKLLRENFLHFLKQDYHYLKYYGRATALIAAKSTSLDTMHASAVTMVSVVRETSSHIAFCKSYGVSMEELQNTPESPATTAYGSFLIDTAIRGDETLLMVAVAACLLGYGEVGLWLKNETQREGSEIFLEGNPYEAWIDEYAGSGYQEAVRIGIRAIEEQLARTPPSPTQFEQMRITWYRCTKLEAGFWDMALGML